MNATELLRISVELDALERVATDTFRPTPYGNGDNSRPWERAPLPEDYEDEEELKDKMAREFGTKEEFQKYLKDHPNADKSNHWVAEKGDKSPSKPYVDKEAITNFVNDRLNTAKNIHGQIKKAPNIVQAFLFNSKYRKESILRGLDAAKKAPENLYNKASSIVKDEINEKVVGLHAATKLLRGEDITPVEKAALVESLRDVSVTVILSIASGGVGALPGSLAIGFAQGVAIRMVSDSIDKLNDVKDTTLVGGMAGKTLLRKGRPFAKLMLKLMKLSSDEEQLTPEMVQHIITLSVVSTVMKHLEKGISDDDVAKALQSYSDSLG